MKSLAKLLFVLILFSIVFVLLRTNGQLVGYDITTLISNLGGLTYLYSTVGTLFAVFAGFLVVSESQDWNMLIKASKGEVKELYEMWLWSQHLPGELKRKFQEAIQQYLHVVIETEWSELSKDHESDAAEASLVSLHDLMAQLSREDSVLGGSIFSNFSEFLRHRDDRLEYSYAPLPFILKFTLLLVDAALILLSFFIGVSDPWLDYIFMLCIVALGTVVYMVINDLDNPLRPGEWQLGPDRYISLLHKIGT